MVVEVANVESDTYSGALRDENISGEIASGLVMITFFILVDQRQLRSTVI